MIEDSLRRISDENYIVKNLDNLIEAFVAFYGEEEREYITQKLKSISVIINAKKIPIDTKATMRACFFFMSVMVMAYSVNKKNTKKRST